MYQPLAPDPLPPGPRVTNPLAPLLALLLRLFNLALAAASLLAVGGALCMAEQYRQGGGGGGGDDPPPPAPEPAAPSNHAVAAAGAAVALASQATASWPWFIYCVGGAGAYGFATALCGLAGLKRGRRLQLGAYILLLALLVRCWLLLPVFCLTPARARALARAALCCGIDCAHSPAAAPICCAVPRCACLPACLPLLLSPRRSWLRPWPRCCC